MSPYLVFSIPSLIPPILRKVWERLPFGHKKITNWDLELAQNAREIKTLADDASALKLELAEEKDKSARLERKYQRAKDEIITLTEAKRKLTGEVREVREEIQTKVVESLATAALSRELSTRLTATDRLLSERTVELKAAQAFLTRADAISEAELVAMVENLNSLVSSVSGALTWDQEDQVLEVHAEDPDLKIIRDDLGTSMVEQIATRNHVAVTLAIQMCLCYFIERVTSGWGDGQVAETLSQIYGMIFTKESQTIASRWRTLTKRYIPRQEQTQSEEIITGLARILFITRSFADFSTAKDFVTTAAGTEIEAVIRATLELDDIIKTKVASSDVFVYIVPPGTTFAEETMTDEFGQGGEDQAYVVAASLEIGLAQKSGGTEKILLKPKVILEKDLVGPAGFVHEAEAQTLE